MRKSLIITGITAACSAVIVGLLLYGVFMSSVTSPEVHTTSSAVSENTVSSTYTPVSSAASSAVSSAAAVFTIKEYRGNIAVFEPGNDEPIQVTNVSVSSLPMVDQEMLRVGIRANSRAELNRLLQDYCS